MSAHFWCTLWLRRCTNKFTFTWNSVYEKNNSVCAEHVENGRNAAFSVNNGLEKPCLPRSIEQRIDMDVDLLKIRTSIKIIMCIDKKWCGYNFSLDLYRQVRWTGKQNNSLGNWIFPNVWWFGILKYLHVNPNTKVHFCDKTSTPGAVQPFQSSCSCPCLIVPL